MSRNLCSTCCSFCGGRVALEEQARFIAEDEAGVYFREYAGRLMVAKAHCEDCNGLYLAWVREVSGGWTRGHLANERNEEFVDLSFRNSFNDEPATEDLFTIHPNKAKAARMRREADAMHREADKLEQNEEPTFWEAFRR